MNLTAESESLAEWLEKVKKEDQQAVDNFLIACEANKTSEEGRLWFNDIEEVNRFIERESILPSTESSVEVELTQNDLSYSYSSGWNASLEHSINIINEYLRLNLIDPRMHDEVISKLEDLKLSN